MENIFYCKNLYDPSKGDELKPKDMLKKNWNKQHRKTIETIRQWVDNNVFHHVA